MATMQEVWGFGRIAAVTTDEDADTIGRFCKALDRAAKERHIAPHVPSDALDMSRDVMVDEAARSLDMQWEIVNDGDPLDTIRLWPIGVTINWETAT